MFLVGVASLILGVTYLWKAILSIQSSSLSGSLGALDRLYWIVAEGLPVSFGRADSFIMPSLMFLGIGVFVVAYGVLQRIREKGIGGK